MKVLNVTNLPIYLPYDKAPIPFGDVFDDASGTLASPSVFTAAGYAPTNGDAVALSVDSGGSLSSEFTPGTRYYVVGASGANFNLSATKGGSAINAAAASSGIALHLVSGEVDGVTLPFKASGTVVVANFSGGNLTLQGASDTGTDSSRPKGPGSWSTIKVCPAGLTEVQLGYDWIRVSTSATLSLLQN